MEFSPIRISLPVRPDRDTIPLTVETRIVAGGGNIPEYIGEYEVTPTFDTQTLETKDMRMTDDVTVNAIPIYIIENQQGGNTIIIGG